MKKLPTYDEFIKRNVSYEREDHKLPTYEEYIKEIIEES